MNKKVFGPYKNKFLYRTAMVFGTGPTLQEYHKHDARIRKDVIQVGVNGFVYNPVIKLDFYFIGDSHGHNKEMIAKGDLDRYQPKAAKFIRTKSDHCPGIPSGHKGNYYQVIGRQFVQDISKGIGASTSIVMEALQFVFYAGFKNVYIVGCDAKETEVDKLWLSPLNHGDGKHTSIWKKMESWSRKFYPDVAIKVINPVGLKALFIEGYPQELYERRGE